ncbi:protein LATERAL BRANCHING OXIDOREDUCTASE 1-like [Silene latifolia]|uniref:protein LATERAL BRANCHING OXIDOREDUCTASE 1-like n=1 Tax=Silene latifolia TaxID=37657 RepID=UPI003D7844E6
MACSKLVQEIALKGESVPERHFVKQDHVIPPAIDAPSRLWEHTLLIDYSLLSSSSSLTHQKELTRLHYALKHWGCFQVINHDITSSFLEELMKVAKEFFSLPIEDKLRYSVGDDFFNGYSNANEIVDNNALNWCDRLFLTVVPEDQRRLEFWPKNPENFRDILNEYSESLRLMLEVLLKAVARSLGLEEDGFLRQHGDQGSISTRLGMYPPCPHPDRVYGVRPHSDESTITVLLQDKDVPEGLHVLKDDQWFKVPVTPGALFINLGDFGEVMSNGIFKSVMHRVVTNPVKERVSVAAFCTPHPETDVEPIAELVSSNRPKMYNKVNKMTFKQIYMHTYPQGKKVVDALHV